LEIELQKRVEGVDLPCKNVKLSRVGGFQIYFLSKPALPFSGVFLSVKLPLPFRKKRYTAVSRPTLPIGFENGNRVTLPFQSVSHLNNFLGKIENTLIFPIWIG